MNTSGRQTGSRWTSHGSGWRPVSGKLTALTTGIAGMTITAVAQARTAADQIPRPTGTLIPGEGVIWFGIFNLAMMVTVFVIMFWIAWRRRSVLPLFFLLGGALGGLVQPIFDGNIHVQFAEMGQPPNWYFYNVGYPWFVIPGNAMLGGPVYLMYRRFQDGISAGWLWLAFLGWWMFNNCWEVPGTTIGSYAYFGPHPFKFMGYPLWIGMMAGLGIPLAGFVAYGIARAMEGPRQWLTTAVLIPVTIYGSQVITWPMWITLNGGASLETTTGMAGLALVFVLIAYNAMIRVYLKGRAGQATVTTEG